MNENPWFPPTVGLVAVEAESARFATTGPPVPSTLIQTNVEAVVRVSSDQPVTETEPITAEAESIAPAALGLKVTVTV